MINDPTVKITVEGAVGTGTLLISLAVQMLLQRFYPHLAVAHSIQGETIPDEVIAAVNESVKETLDTVKFPPSKHCQVSTRTVMVVNRRKHSHGGSKPLPQIKSRLGDMGENLKLELLRDNDGDIIVSVMPANHRFTNNAVEFCVPSTGGGTSPRTFAALQNLMRAMEEDDVEFQQPKANTNTDSLYTRLGLSVNPAFPTVTPTGDNNLTTYLKGHLAADHFRNSVLRIKLIGDRVEIVRLNNLGMQPSHPDLAVVVKDTGDTDTVVLFHDATTKTHFLIPPPDAVFTAVYENTDTVSFPLEARTS